MNLGPSNSRAGFPRLFSIIAWWTLATHAAVPLPPAADRPVDFVKDIQPIFARHCLSCHGPEKQRSAYRLDVKSVGLKGGDSGRAAILPGNGARSPLVELVGGQNPDLRMPPKGEALKDEEISLIRAWIDHGANWPDEASAQISDPKEWWSLRPIRRMDPPQIPAAERSGSTIHPIDAFIRARLAKEGLSPAPEADRRTLIRRLTFDLLGLPPAPEEVADFVADSRPDAYERLVDRLLASPHYGERWARHWLDIVHYGDTHGYDKDKPRPNAWPYRDYVIRAFNEDKPYHRFVEEQIAGDVLYPDTADGLEALGFISAGPWDFIGHEELPETKIDGKIARHLDRDDMVANTIGTFASLTIHCAQCHDHKFDPIPQEDYYRLQSVFAALDRSDRRYYRDPDLNHERNAREIRVRDLARREREVRDEIARLGGNELKKAEEKLAAAERTAKEGQPAEYGWHSGISPRPDEPKWVQVDLGRTVEFNRILLAPCRDDFNQIGDGFGFPPRYRIEASDDQDFSSGRILIVDQTAGDIPNPGVTRQSYVATGGKGRFVRVTATKLAPRQNDYIFALAELEIFNAAGTNLARGASVTSLDSVEAPVRWARVNLTDGKAPGSTATVEEPGRLRGVREELLVRLVPAAIRDDLDKVTRDLAAARRAIDELPAPLIVYSGIVLDGKGNFRGTGPDNGRPRPIFVLPRGDVTRPGREISPGALSCVAELSSVFDLAPGAPEDLRRAALAQWLTDPAQPLTWRSIVNRVWQYHFGHGLVETPNDFGRMGSMPSHPELLDWLAAEFRDGGQSMKSLHRLIVTSETYRQGAGSDAVDPDNRLLARMTPRRLDAESVRDSILAVSGRLDPAMYGPGFQDFVIEKPEHSPHYQYHLHDPDDVCCQRRSIYRFLVRSQQEPLMMALDCADPSMRVDRRNETLTPLQALALLNSRLTVVMARHFADRVEREAGPSAEARIDRAFQLVVQRTPLPEEKNPLLAYSKDHGLAATCRLLLNLNEFVFVD